MTCMRVPPPRLPSPVGATTPSDVTTTCIRPKRPFTIESLISPDNPSPPPPAVAPEITTTSAAAATTPPTSCVQWGLNPYCEMGLTAPMMMPPAGFYNPYAATVGGEDLLRIPQVVLRSVWCVQWQCVNMLLCRSVFCCSSDDALLVRWGGSFLA